MAYDDDLVDPYTYARMPDDTGPTPLQNAQDEADIRSRIGELPETLKQAAAGGDNYSVPIAPPPDRLVGSGQPADAAPATGMAGVKMPADAAPDAVGFTVGDPADFASSGSNASIVGELGSGLARGFKHTAAEVGDLAATAASKTGDWTDTTWLKNLGSTISDYDKGLTKVDPSAISSMTMAQARAKGVMTAWLVGKAAEQAVPLTSIIAMGTAMPLAPIIYGAAVGANEEAKNPDATGGSVATAAIGNAAMMGMPIHILQSAVGQTFFKKLAADVLGFAGLGAAGEFQEPATKAARGEGFEMPSLGQLGEGAVIGGMSGAMARPAQVGVNAVSRMLGRGKAGQPPPPVDADVQAATQQALPPPSPENRPDVMNVPPTGPDQMSSSDIIPPAAGTLDRPGDIAAANVDPDSERRRCASCCRRHRTRTARRRRTWSTCRRPDQVRCRRRILSRPRLGAWTTLRLRHPLLRHQDRSRCRRRRLPPRCRRLGPRTARRRRPRRARRCLWHPRQDRCLPPISCHPRLVRWTTPRRRCSSWPCRRPTGRRQSTCRAGYQGRPTPSRPRRGRWTTRRM